MAVTGCKTHTDRLKRMASQANVERVGKALFKAGLAIQVEAQTSITKGKVSGKGHVRSKPGQAPNEDTGVLSGNIETVQEAPLRVTVSSNAPYAIPLELGTSKMAARPYMKPAVAKKRDEVTAYVRRVIQNTIGG
ncbi:HK97 gp10 family phage protein [Sphingomonas paeninsulae]|uniref:HK97 gp10 family phage protein n=1 Tax=Sphingomonas paeninsulae TaxID=2319844 RepID=A0A494TQR1_SPHPE|nr:HK97-gp10 family putative phage morphogenesis protein [Sphingomonas paeninsulae]AYJ88136.1 HK97 gp10 family phage protein [Sphingomonas paeninsulae]